MPSPDAPLPTYKDICPDALPTLDAEHAAKNFLGKTLAEAETMFRENLIHYTEDLWVMGTPAFEYYLPALWNYITSDASGDDHTVAGIVNVVFQCRHEQGTLGRTTPLVLQCIDYLITNYDKFKITDPDNLENNKSANLDIKELVADLQQDEGMRQLLETEWANSGGNPDAFPELLKSLEDLPAQFNFEPYPSGQSELNRWKALSEAIAKTQT